MPPKRKKCMCIPKPWDSIDTYKMRISKIEKALAEYQKHLDVTSEKDRFVGAAFVTFNN